VIGPWQVWLAVDREGRFPDVQAAVPRSCPTRVTFDDRDVAELVRALGGLPGERGESRPVTLDLGPHVGVRGRDDQAGDSAEVPLPHTTAAGPPCRFVLDRAHLGRALALGFRELRVSSPERPVAFRDPDRVFVAATLDPALVVPRAGGPDVAPASTAIAPSPAIPTNPERRIPMPTRDAPPPDRNGHPAPAGEPFDPVAEAEALRADLADAAARAHRLVAALKQFRKERRALTSAWSSLRQLNLGS
jgi:hypothetical protein